MGFLWALSFPGKTRRHQRSQGMPSSGCFPLGAAWPVVHRAELEGGKLSPQQVSVVQSFSQAGVSVWAMNPRAASENWLALLRRWLGSLGQGLCSQSRVVGRCFICVLRGFRVRGWRPYKIKQRVKPDNCQGNKF